MNENNQVLPIEHKSDGETLAVKSVWATIQGEGPFTGWPAIFIRLGGCNLACWFCDTAYAVHDGEERWNVSDIMHKVSLHQLPVAWPLVVITGGEPFRQNIFPLVAHLLGQGYQVQIETSGSAYQDLRGWWDHPMLTIVCSPKLPKIHKKLEPHIDAYKYVLRAGEISEHGLPSTSTQSVEIDTADKMQVAVPGKTWAPVYVSPMDEEDEAANEANVRACAEAAMTHGYRVSLQVHKLIGVP